MEQHRIKRRKIEKCECDYCARNGCRRGESSSQESLSEAEIDRTAALNMAMSTFEKSSNNAVSLHFPSTTATALDAVESTGLGIRMRESC
jgi:hypothetical protein